MAIDAILVHRVRPLISRRKGFSEKRMFGGIAFLLDGKMCVGVWKEFLIVRIGLEAYDAAIELPFVNEFNFTGRAMKGWVMIEPAGIIRDIELNDWVQIAIKFVRRLPKK